MNRIESMFGSMVFGDAAMRERLPESVYNALRQTMSEGTTLDRSIADTVANAMKDWAMERGATHYSHWFQPMTGITAEKHEAFLSPAGDGGALAEFSGKELIKGEPDASSFPSGGLRVTFEARGYTAWDPTSYAFIKDDTLCIPTAFCSYTGEVLDKKTPLLRSNEALNRQALRVLRLLGDTRTRRVITTSGAEQEYFLLDRAMYAQRPDLKYTGRTLFGARAPRGQELSDQYSGALRTRVSRYMRDLDDELWKLGIYAKTEHNEAAPAQHELAPVFTNVNTACDHNQLTMELMKKVAERHDFVCLLHEKPFSGVNGSGKHNNWSICTDGGENLLDPGAEPAANTRFLLFMAAMIRAADLHQDLLRISTATAGNDNRLGGAEAPPVIISMYIGEDMCAMLDAIAHHESVESEERAYMETGLGIIPRFRKDNSDRNRTSPFAFTGNKFEFRMPGSSSSVADPNIMLNTIMADTLMYFADEMEKAEDPAAMARKLIRRSVREHSRILFNGNNYAPEWAQEAEKRGLLNLGSAAEAIGHLTDEKNVELFARHGIYTEVELTSRREIMLENYSKTLRIEALTALDMVRRDILPAISAFTGELSAAAISKRQLNISCAYEISVAGKLSSMSGEISELAEKLDMLLDGVPRTGTAQNRALYYRNEIFAAMTRLRTLVDSAELSVGSEYWPYPSYGEMLFSEE